MPEPQTTWEFVEHYINLGWYIGPTYWIEDGKCACWNAAKCKSAAKHPLTQKGFNDFTNDIERAREYWTRWPKAGIGVDLERSGLVFIGPDSPIWKERFEQRGLHHGAAIMDSGGGEGHVHYYYKLPEGSLPARINRPKEFDIQASGIGVLPPSPHVSGRTRKWENLVDRWLPDAPPEVTKLLKEKAEVSPELGELPPLPAQATAPTELPVRLGQEGVERWVGSKVDYKEGTNQVDTSLTIHNMGRELAKAGATKETIYHLLHDWSLTQGYGKFANRPTEYWRTAIKAVDEVEAVPTSQPLDEGDFQVYSLKQLLEFTFEKPSYFVEPIVPSTGIILIAGASGSLKTAVIADLFLALLEQRTWLDYYTVPLLEGKRILYLDGEVGLQTIQKRLLSMGAQPSEDLDYIYRRWHIENDREYKGLMDLARTGDYGLILIDSISAVHGLEERNDTTVRIMQRLRDIADAANCPLIVLANFNKSTSEKRELLERISGPSVYRNKSSAIITLRRIGGKRLMKARMQLQKDWLGGEGEARTIELREKEGILRFTSEPWEPLNDGDDDGTDNGEQDHKASSAEVARLELYLFLRDKSNDEDLFVRDIEDHLHFIVSVEAAKQAIQRGISEGVLTEPVRKGRGGAWVTRRLL